MDPDFWLIQKMKMGDGQAVEDFVRKYYPGILKYCRLHIRDRGDAEDMTQETFERFFRSFDSYSHYGKAANYLYVIAANRCKDYYRKGSGPVAIQDPEAADRSMESIDGWLDIRIAFDKLPDEVRETAALFFLQGLKQREIAKILGIGIPLVKYRIKKSRELLAALLEKEDDL